MADKPRAEFDLESLLRKLRTEETTEGWTVEELCEKAGWPPYDNYKARVRKHIVRRGQIDGTWEKAGEKWIENYRIDGQGQWVPAYRPTSKGK